MTETDAVQDRMRGTLDAEIDSWLPEGSVRLWEDEAFFDGGFLQKNVLAVDTEVEDGSVTIIRAWMSGPLATPSISVDLQMSYEQFAGDFNEEAFPHAQASGGNPLEIPFRAHLLGEHTEIVWQSISDPTHSTFIARTAKVGRGEQVVAGTVTMNDGASNVDLSLRQHLAALQPTPRRALLR